MRVLVVASPLAGHVLPLVPLALALRDAGADVVVATAGDGMPSCPPELSPTDVAPGVRLGPLFGSLMLRRPRLGRRELDGRGGTEAVGLLFGTLGARIADGVLAAADRHRPDLVVHEPLAPAGAEAAASRGVPSVLVEGNLYDAEVLLAAAAGTDLDVVLVRPDHRVARRRLPPPVRTADWLPFPQVVPAAAGVVHHGGAGTVLTALAAGVPQLVVRGAGDRRTNGDLVAARGAGLAVDPGGVSAALLERPVADPALAAAAREVAAEIAAMPAPAAVAPGLLALAGR